MPGGEGGVEEADLLVAEEAVGEDGLVGYVFVAIVIDLG